MRKLAESRRPKRNLKRRQRRAVVPTRSSQYQTGMNSGYQEGLRTGQSSFGTYFEGTSIIIPNYNQVDYLKQCIASIRRFTNPPFEIIVVDNASTDGAGAYLASLGSAVRYRVLESNRGFAGAINVGMMMARGSYLLLLNNDTVVAENWLSNMLACLNSSPTVGMVGPVTNYISGDQRIEVPYKTVRGMPNFARQHNVSNPSRWQQTDRLTGFCLLMRRELWDRTGFMDEGYTVGNYEDDDYNIRVRLQGYSLMIARDTFIHHFGSVSIRALGERVTVVNDHNRHVYMEKWGNPHDLVHFVRGIGHGMIPAGETAFFPQHVIVRGSRDNFYWIEDGIKRLIAGPVAIPATRLSRVELRRWPIGEPISVEEAQAKWHGVTVEGLPWSEGLMARGMDGLLYMVENGTKRKVASAKAAEDWHLVLKPNIAFTPEQISSLPEGLPIIAPIRTADHL
ncbi:GT2 family glycosyltransferase [Paenibacillus taihuensis]|uniref:GT2 family glycosyltransferase n=1 Tax=Paenibacillus taihuensis TaxID=1156355 RepID=A0A3D9SAY2_9BACL|nr:glycosyltransferase family 2 protein [Paenibacillus taihuensis]REE86229.1 GT2 family glycosyltransferase [Paenibacillus taihuensis]